MVNYFLRTSEIQENVEMFISVSRKYDRKNGKFQVPWDQVAMASHTQIQQIVPSRIRWKKIRKEENSHVHFLYIAQEHLLIEQSQLLTLNT